jgi:hypothetical protein
MWFKTLKTRFCESPKTLKIEIFLIRARNMSAPFFALTALLLIGLVPFGLLVFVLRKRAVLRFVVFSGAFLMAFTQIKIAWEELSGNLQEKHYQQINVFLDKATSFEELNLDWERSLFAMSIMAEGLAEYANKNPDQREHIKTRLRKIIELSTDSTFCHSVDTEQKWKGNGLYISHLALILAYYQRLEPQSVYQGLHRKLITFLAQEMLQSPDYHIQSYVYLPDKWICDQAVSLRAIQLYDGLFGTELSRQIIPKWEKVAFEASLDSLSNLPCTRLNQGGKCQELPRASSLAWLISFLPKISPDKSSLYWDNYKQHFKQNLINACIFREYLDRQPSVEDYDSGLMLFSWGSVGTGLSIRSAAFMQDWLTYFQLKNTFFVAQNCAFLLAKANQNYEIVGKMADDWLTVAILFSAETKMFN